MNKEILEIINELSKKPTGELALCLAESEAENIDLNNRINKAIEYIETLEKREAYKIVDNENGVPSLVVDNEEYLVLCKYNKLLDILKGENND